MASNMQRRKCLVGTTDSLFFFSKRFEKRCCEFLLATGPAHLILLDLIIIIIFCEGYIL
jgi:hypothetical protein